MGAEARPEVVLSREWGARYTGARQVRREEKGTTEDEMVRWHHRLSGHEFEQTLGDGDG